MNWRVMGFAGEIRNAIHNGYGALLFPSLSDEPDCCPQLLASPPDALRCHRRQGIAKNRVYDQAIADFQRHDGLIFLMASLSSQSKMWSCTRRRARIHDPVPRVIVGG